MKLSPFILSLGVALTACGDGNGRDRLVGTYVLETVNGHSLPVTSRETATLKEELTANILTFTGDLRFTMMIRTRITQSGSTNTVNETKTGTWTETGNAVILILDNQAPLFTAIRIGDTLSIRAEGLVFRRQ